MTIDEQIKIIQSVLYPDGKTIWDELNEKAKKQSRVFSWDPPTKEDDNENE